MAQVATMGSSRPQDTADGARGAGAGPLRTPALPPRGRAPPWAAPAAARGGGARNRERARGLRSRHVWLWFYYTNLI